MRQHPTPEQFSEHHCEHFEMREGEEYCTFYAKAIDDPSICCSNTCSHYSPWDCDIEELLQDETDASESEPGVIAAIKLVVKHGRQPRCPLCLLPLEVVEMRTILIRWSWDAEQKRYRKTQDKAESTGLRCSACGVKCWNFTNNGVMEY